MHFYQKHIGDFNNATRHLTRVERSLYSDAIELYYQTENPLTNDINKLRKLLLAVTDEEKEALDSILIEYFTGTENGYFHKRCDEEINKYQSFIDSRSRAGKASAEKRINTCSTRVQHKGNIKATQGQLTNNHKPITNNQEPIDISTNVDIVETPKKTNGVPYKEIEKLYHECLPMLSGIYKWNEKRKRQVKALWHSELEELTSWKNYFAYIARSKFLTGRAQGKDGRAWKADFDFIINETNFIKIAEGKYDEKI